MSGTSTPWVNFATLTRSCAEPLRKRASASWLSASERPAWKATTLAPRREKALQSALACSMLQAKRRVFPKLAGSAQ